MKDEYGGTAIYEYVGTKSKEYSIRDVNNCKKSVYKVHTANIRHKEVLDVQANGEVIRHNMNVIKSYKHKMYTSSIDKRSLSCFNDKKYILEDGINTLAFGDKGIPIKFKKIIWLIHNSTFLLSTFYFLLSTFLIFLNFTFI